MTVADLLRGWGVKEEYIANFIAEEISERSLRLQTPGIFEKLIPHAGPRALFLEAWNEWKGVNIDNNRPGSSNSNSSIDSGSSSNSCTSTERRKRVTIDSAKLSAIIATESLNDLHGYLKKNFSGVLILCHYDAQEILDDYCRDILAQQVIFQQLEGCYTKKLTRDDYNRLSNDIIKIFPTECKETWYEVVQKKNSTVVYGRLRHKYYSVRRTLVNACLLDKDVLRAELDEDKPPSNPGIIGNDEDDPDFMWLVNCKGDDWPLLEERWAKTVDRRLVHLKKCKQNLEYINKFQFLKNPLGWKLISADGEKKLGKLDNFWQLWEPYSKFLIKLVRQQQKKFLNDPSLTESQKLVCLLVELPSLFKVRQVPKSPEASKSSKCWRVNKESVKRAFCMHVNSVPEMIDNIKTRNKLLQTYKFPSQPTLVVLGPLSAIRQVFIVLDDSRWEVSNVAEGFVGVFQMIFGLDTSYPVEARHLFLFLQRTLFGLEFNNDFKDDKGLSNFLKARLNEYDLFKS